MAFLEGKLGHPEPSPTQNASVANATPSLWSPQGGHPTPQTTTSGLDNNPVGEIVGLLALTSSEAPAYVGASSGLSLAANLGEMVQTSVWNQFISRMHQSPNPGVCNAAQSTAAPDTSQPQAQPGRGCTRARDPANLEFPNDELGSKILETYFKRLHSRYPFLDRKRIWRLHEDRGRLAKIKREDLTQTDRYGIFKLNLIYAIGSTMLLQITSNKPYVYTQPEVS